MGGAPNPKWDPIGFDPQPHGGNDQTKKPIGGLEVRQLCRGATTKRVPLSRPSGGKRRGVGKWGGRCGGEAGQVGACWGRAGGGKGGEKAPTPEGVFRS